MSQITMPGKFYLPLLICLILLAGCSTPNDKASFDPDTGHSSDWVYAKHSGASQEDINSCMECHGADLAGGMSGVACSECHLNGSPLTLTDCTSCHGNPPSGTSSPNRSGSHAVHNALPHVANACDTCHNGAGSNTPNHDNGAVDVSIAPPYNAKSGAAVHNADETCSKVSCHGGQTTPVWLTGTIDVNTQCTFCHVYGSTEYNSYSSGQHDIHVNEQHLLCTACHDTTNLAVNHFTNLNTPIMEGPASATLRSALSYTNGTCTPACHGQQSW